MKILSSNTKNDFEKRGEMQPTSMHSNNINSLLSAVFYQQTWLPVDKKLTKDNSSNIITFRDDRATRLQASKMAIVTIFRSWAGNMPVIITLSNSKTPFLVH